jgi:ABC transport system ATP-binding/permease protein
MVLITVLDAHLAYSDRPLLDGAQLTVRAGERLGLIGRNGTGKSTLLRAIANLVQLDEGEVQRRDGLKVGFVEQ